MAKRVSKVEEPEASNIVSSLVSALNKSFNKELGGEDASFLLDDPNLFAKVTDYVSSGLDILDIAMSNKKGGGYGVGRIVEITGLEGSGKSLLAAYALKDTQRQGGIGVYIDTENAVSVEYMEAIGIDSSKLMYVPLNHIEDVFEAIERIIVNVRTSDKKIPVTIVVDSVMATTTKIEAAAGYDKDGYATQKALILSKGLRKITRMIGSEKILLIFTNQLRMNVGALGFGAEKYVTSGGKAIAFHSTIRLRLISEGKIKKKVNGIDNVVGIKTACKVIKNRLGPPLKQVKFDIYYESGVDNYGSWLTTLKDYNLIRQSGAYYTLNFPEMDIVDVNGEIQSISEIKFQSKDFKGIMMRNANLKDHIYNQVCDQYIMTYKNGDDYGIDDVEIDEDDED
jgi:recombination protein RecA